MSLNRQEIRGLEETIQTSLRNALTRYDPEPHYMPFHTRLLGKDRLALYSFIHSLNTNFGTSIFEPAAVALASSRFREAKRSVKAGACVSEVAQKEIQRIMDGLTTASIAPNKKREIEVIRAVCQQGEMKRVKLTKVDVYLEGADGEIFLFDLKTAKPNIGDFKEFKRTLLEWVAAILAEQPNAHVNTLIAIPYNPQEPEPYNRWTMRGMLDLEHELKVAQEFWDFVGGVGAYEDLLGCFERAGIEMREEIDHFFARFLKTS